jgi:hypothetical protein
MTITTILYLALGLGVGAGLAWLHAAATRRSAAAAVDRGSVAPVLVGLPLRVLLPAAGIFALALLSPWALGGAMLGFVVGQLLVLGQR